MNRRLASRTAIIIFILGSVMFWVWAFSPLAPRGNADRIPDREFPVAAESTCADTRTLLDTINADVPRLTEPAQRAVIVDEATDALALMVGQLEQTAADVYADLRSGVTESERLEELDEWHTVIGRWIDDWTVYVADRRNHADRLRAEGDVEVLLSLVDDVDVAERLTGFAHVNDMESCEVPGDL